MLLNEDVLIPPELANQYLSIKKQMNDKQSKKDQLMKAVNQVDNEMNILQKNLVAIEVKASQMQGQEPSAAENQENNQQATGSTTVEVEGKIKESLSLDERWKKYINEDIDLFADEAVEEVDDEDEEDMDKFIDEPLEEPEGQALEGDYVFSLKIEDSDEEEDIIAKFYKNEDDDFWKVRVVQGSEDPLETMQFDPEMDMVEIIEHLATMYDEVEEMDVQEYQDLLDDKEIIDQAFYDDIIEEE